MFTNEGKIAGEYIDARGITIKDADGNDVVYFDETGIHWNKAYSPIKYQFSTSMNGPWHDTYATNDEYRRESFDGGTTWEAPYKLVGKDGQPGSDGSDGDPKGYLKSIQITEITKDGVKSPLIQGARIEGAEIWGGEITSGSVINVTTDAHIGRNLYLGDLDDDSVKMLRFSGRASISTWGSGLEVGSLRLSCNHLDMQGVSTIDWGKNAPVAVLG